MTDSNHRMEWACPSSFRQSHLNPIFSCDLLTVPPMRWLLHPPLVRQTHVWGEIPAGRLMISLGHLWIDFRTLRWGFSRFPAHLPPSFPPKSGWTPSYTKKTQHTTQILLVSSPPQSVSPFGPSGFHTATLMLYRHMVDHIQCIDQHILIDSHFLRAG